MKRSSIILGGYMLYELRHVRNHGPHRKPHIPVGALHGGVPQEQAVNLTSPLSVGFQVAGRYQGLSLVTNPNKDLK
jgi:hypothetical protein